ncbi:ribonuclease E/G, partial [Francisella tularensis]|uniref:ribonuclease E/G n=1 Tax=Francisella tularensis TaxID=263 RepID=UPI001680B28C
TNMEMVLTIKKRVRTSAATYVDKRQKQEETKFKKNLKATKVIESIIILINLVGSISIDFIAMMYNSHRIHVLEALKQELEQDKDKISVCDISEIGLVEMTSTRVHECLLIN